MRITLSMEMIIAFLVVVLIVVLIPPLSQNLKIP